MEDFNCVDAKRWSNVLGVVELLFCLPLSNRHLEWVFSQIKFIKNDRRIHLTENRLDQLVRIDCCGPPIGEWTLQMQLQNGIMIKRGESLLLLEGDQVRLEMSKMRKNVMQI